MKPPVITVTDHALMRYLERVMGYDLQPIRARIAEAVRTGTEAGAKCVSAEGVTFHLDGFKVITITPGATPNGAYQKTQLHRGKSIRMQRGRR